MGFNVLQKYGKAHYAEKTRRLVFYFLATEGISPGSDKFINDLIFYK